MNNLGDHMTTGLDPDTLAAAAGKTLALPFESSATEMAGIRVTRAEFSRIMGCSKQAVTEWVKSGRIAIGIDGRLDPRQAVTQLLRTGDPARLRAKVLEPLAREVAGATAKLTSLQSALQMARENAEFQEGAANELLEVLQAFAARLEEGWDDLMAMERSEAIILFKTWLDIAQSVGADPGIGILDVPCPLPAARDSEAKGERGQIIDGDDNGKNDV